MKDSNSAVLEVEIDDHKRDSHLYFPPIGQPVRGRCDFGRMARRDPNAIMLTTHFPNGVPGQRIRIDFHSKRCSIVEPLHLPEFELCRKEIERRGLPIPVAEETYTPANLADWLWTIKRAIDAGYARVTCGELPKDLGEETPRKENLDPGEQRIDRLCTLIESLLGRLVPAGA